MIAQQSPLENRHFLSLPLSRNNYLSGDFCGGHSATLPSPCPFGCWWPNTMPINISAGLSSPPPCWRERQKVYLGKRRVCGLNVLVWPALRIHGLERDMNACTNETNIWVHSLYNNVTTQFTSPRAGLEWHTTLPMAQQYAMHALEWLDDGDWRHLLKERGSGAYKRSNTKICFMSIWKDMCCRNVLQIYILPVLALITSAEGERICAVVIRVYL